MMNTLLIESTKKTPEVLLDPSKGYLLISGMSCSENATGFFVQIFDWITEYIPVSLEKTTIDFKLKYYNTSSAKCILDVLDRLLLVKEQGKNLEVNWYYDPSDDEMLESGENYSAILDHNFNYFEL